MRCLYFNISWMIMRYLLLIKCISPIWPCLVQLLSLSSYLKVKILCVRKSSNRPWEALLKMPKKMRMRIKIDKLWHWLKAKLIENSLLIRINLLLTHLWIRIKVLIVIASYWMVWIFTWFEVNEAEVDLAVSFGELVSIWIIIVEEVLDVI